MARRIGDYEVVHGSNDLTRDAYLARTGAGENAMLALFDIDESERRVLIQEVEHAQRLRHPAVTRVTEVFAHEEATVVVLEHVTGVTLSMLTEHLREEGERIADGAAMYITRELLGALLEAHRARGAGKALVHPRLEPEQVVITWDGGVKLVGLGLSPIYRIAAERSLWPALVRCAAPEVRSGGAVKPMANLYSAALMLWSVLAQRDPPAQGRPPSLARLRPDLDAALARAVDGALAPTPSSRFVAEQKLVQYLNQRVTQHDREELRWNMEVLRALLVVDDLVCSTALPPTRARALMPSVPPASARLADEAAPSSVEPTRRAVLHAPDERDALPSESDMATPQFHRLEPREPDLPVAPPVNPVIGFLSRARSSYPPMPEVFPARPVLAVVAAAVTLAFAAGFLVGRFSASSPGVVVPPTAAEAPPLPEPSATPHASSSTSTVASASASAAPSAEVPALAASAAALPPTQGVLIVEPSTDGAFVYVNGRHAGATAEPLTVLCGSRFVRLGTRPLRRWFGRGRVVEVKCRDITTTTMKPGE